MHDVEAVLAARREVGAGLWVLGFDAPAIAAEAEPGQFVDVLLRPGPLLRRPFSVYRAPPPGMVEIVVRAVGEGTRRLIGLRMGDTVSMLGPLGRGFAIDPVGPQVTLLSGGVGVGPMPLAAARAAEAGLDVRWVHGARTAADLCREWWGEEVVWATEDGSRGLRGTALDAITTEPGQLLACGPNPMLAAVAARFPAAQVAVEVHMGCGTGVCLGCAVPGAGGGYSRACTEGPVYPAASIAWAAMAGEPAEGAA